MNKLNAANSLILRCISPIHRANRQAGIFMEGMLKDLDVSAPEAHMLSFIGLYGPSSVGELVRVFGYRKPTMTSMLNKLEKRGYLARELNPGDRRSLLIRLTPDGEKVAVESRRRVEKLEAAILAKVSESDMTGFQHVLNVLSEVTGVEVRKATSNHNPGHTKKE